MDAIRDLAIEIKRLYEEDDRHPFPYEGCRFLLAGMGDEFKSLVPDLDTYFSEIAGYSSWGPRILKWPEEKVREAHGRVSLSFFEQYPEYSVLQGLVSESATPDLYEDLALYEQMRGKLFGLLSCLLLESREGRSS
jgi:hypothetical protein